MREVAVPKNTDSRASAVGQLGFSDIQGPLELPRMHGKRYALSFMDDINRLNMKKSGVLLKFQEFAAEHGAPKCPHTDNGGEYSSNAFRILCR